MKLHTIMHETLLNLHQLLREGAEADKRIKRK